MCNIAYHYIGLIYYPLVTVRNSIFKRNFSIGGNTIESNLLSFSLRILFIYGVTNVSLEFW